MPNRLKRMLVLASCCLFFSMGWAIGQTKKTKRDAADWKLFNDTERTLYVSGFMHGHFLGKLDGAHIALMAIVHSRTFTRAQEHTANDRIYDALVKTATEDPTNGEIADTMSTFYGDYRNAAVDWDDALLFSVASLKGHAPSEQELDAARKKGAAQK